MGHQRTEIGFRLVGVRVVGQCLCAGRDKDAVAVHRHQRDRGGRHLITHRAARSAAHEHTGARAVAEQAQQLCLGVRSLVAAVAGKRAGQHALEQRRVDMRGDIAAEAHSIANCVRPMPASASAPSASTKPAVLSLSTGAVDGSSAFVAVASQPVDARNRASKSPLASNTASRLPTVTGPFTNRTAADLPLVSTHTSMSATLAAL